MGAVVAITDWTFEDASRYEAELAPIRPRLVLPPPPPGHASVAALAGADALLHEHLELTGALLRALPRCRVIAHHGKGVDNIDLDAANALGIVIANVPDASPHEVSEHVFALLLALARKIRDYDTAVRRGVWDVRSGEPVRRMAGRTLGLVGFGGIARAVARKARAFGMPILVWMRSPDDALLREHGALAVGLDELFTRADVVSLHLPLNAETAGIASRRRIASMKRDAILINVSRGALVDETALAEALREGRLAGAGLDVLVAEPPVVHPLIDEGRTILTPHCAWYSEEGRDDVERRTARAALDVLRGVEPASWVNPEVRAPFEARFGPLLSRASLPGDRQ